MNAESEAVLPSPKDATKSEWIKAVAKAPEALIRAWNYPLLKNKWPRLILFLLIFAVCATRALIGLTGTELFSHDAFVFIDGAWRLLNGQRPHVDFFSNLGVLAYVPTAVGLLLSHGTAWGFGYGEAVTGLALGFWSYALGRSRLRDLSAALMCLLVVLMATAPSTLGFSALQISPATVYNRHGYALLALILIEAFTDGNPARRRSEFLGGCSTGAVVVILFFLKVTYSAAAAFLVFALIPCRRQTKQRWLGLAVGACFTTLLVCSYFHFDMLPMARDLRLVAQARHLYLLRYLVNDILEHILVFLAFALSAASLLSLHNQRQSARAVVIASVATCLAGLVIFTNYELSGFQLPAFAALLLVDRMESSLSGEKEPHAAKAFHSAVLVFAAALFLAPVLSDALSFGSALGSTLETARHSKPLKVPALAGFVPIRGDEAYGELVDDGLDLVTANRHTGETIMCLDFSNPFSFALAATPAPGGATVMQYKNTFNDDYKPSPAFLFGRADLVLQPKHYTETYLQDAMPRLYGPYLKSHFNEVAESSEWKLYRRIPAAP